MSDTARLTTAKQARAFLIGGNATVTLVSVKTGTRFTYKVRASDDGEVYFVSLLSGPDNESDYRYLGRIARGIFWQGRKVPKAGDVLASAPSSQAFAWVWRAVMRDELPDTVEVWHEGRCARCNRKLTVPKSIESGFGPECADKVGVTASWA